MEIDFPDIPGPLRERGTQIEPAPDLASWTRSAFIAEGAPLENSDHEHLRHARIGVLLTNVRYTTKGKQVCGEAREAAPSGANDWKRASRRQQLLRWFGEEWEGQLPDFLITLDAPYVAGRLEKGDTAAVCALVEHELYHCAQATDRHGFPQFDDATGRPKWTVAPHDLEEFTGVAERYGAATGQLGRMQKALMEGPTVDPADVDAVCGCGATVG